MCLILLAYKSHPGFPLIIAANRDEFYHRPTSKAYFWSQYPDVLAGRDLESGGTWMGMTKYGKIAMLTNIRDPDNWRQDSPSRGYLVSDFLIGHDSPDDYLNRLLGQSDQYNGFNLIFGTWEIIYFYTNQGDSYVRLTPGVFGFSNGPLESNWPKVQRGKAFLSKHLADRKYPSVKGLLDILADDKRAPDHLLPVPLEDLEKERMLSSIFVKSPNYGTRSSTIILINGQRRVLFAENTFDQKIKHDSCNSDNPFVCYSFRFK